MNSPNRPTPDKVAAFTLNQRERFSTAYSVLERAIADHAFPGCAFGVVLDGNLIALDGIGRFTYAADSPAVTPETVYDLASLTKAVAATSAAMLLCARGVLDLDQPLGEVLPGFVIGQPSPRERCQVTLRMLLAHSSGLPAYARLFEANRTPAQLLNACLRMPLDAAPGTRAEYSDIGFILLGKALEVLCGQPLDAFCREEVFAPLGMAATGFRPRPEARSLIPPTENDTAFRHRILQGEVHDENCSVLGGVSAHAGLFSNVPDLLRFAQCIMADGKTADGLQIFDRDVIKVFSCRQNPQPASSRALGWDTPSGESSSGHHFSRNSVGHLGYTGTSIWIDLDNRFAIVLLTNRTWPDRASQAIRAVRPEFHDAVFNALKTDLNLFSRR